MLEFNEDDPNLRIQFCEDKVEKSLNNRIFYSLHAFLSNAHSFLMATSTDMIADTGLSLPIIREQHLQHLKRLDE